MVDFNDLEKEIQENYPKYFTCRREKEPVLLMNDKTDYEFNCYLSNIKEYYLGFVGLTVDNISGQILLQQIRPLRNISNMENRGIGTLALIYSLRELQKEIPEIQRYDIHIPRLPSRSFIGYLKRLNFSDDFFWGRKDVSYDDFTQNIESYAKSKKIIE